VDDLGIARDRILQIENCVDDERFRGNVEPAVLEAPGPRALVVGQLFGRKGVEELLRATARVQQGGTAMSLIVAGTGPDLERPSKLAATLDVREVHWLGHVSSDGMPSIYRTVDFLVFPKLEDVWELVVNEALLSGTPVICSIYAGCAEELVPPDNRFHPTNPADFADVLHRAATGRIASADRSTVKGTREIGSIIVSDIEQRIGRAFGGDAPSDISF